MINRENITVLIVEDNEFNASFVNASLQGIGVTTDIAVDGKEALEFVENHTYDLIFMDCQMPILDGFEATRIIRCMRNDNSQIPIIALSATISEEQKLKCMDCGMNDILQKPLNVESLKRILEKYIKFKINEKVFLPETANSLSEAMKFSYEDALGLLNDFYRITSQTLTKMEAAYITDKADEVKKYAHQIKGMACNLRLRDIQQIASNMEKDGIGSRDEINYLKDMIEKLK